jgi:thioredoxin reductase/NAD-dependent dihydropyrimidine dehydrogenase PreA subunit
MELTAALIRLDPVSALVAASLVALAVAFGVTHLVRRRVRHVRDAAALEEKIANRQDVPRSLYPVIDPEICIGSLACLQACPEDVLGIVGGVGKLVHADQCIGHGKCAAECPVGAITRKMGTASRGVDLPEVDEWFESSRPGVHVVGELGGMGLVKNALDQGTAAARRRGEVLRGGGGDPGAVDVVIVGAGPAGLATAFGIQHAGLRYRIFEQASVGGTIANYPRHKIVMTEPVKVPLAGTLGRRTISKERFLESIQTAIANNGVRVEEGVKVEAIDGEDGRFVVRTSAGPVAARKVVLATGRRGTPRKLDVPGEERTKVTYALVDPDQYRRKKILVVGGGDSALEAAAQLVDEAHAEVTLSYRGDAFARARDANRKKVEALAAQGRLRVLLSSQVTGILEREVELAQQGRPLRLANDYVLVLIGGELPTEFLSRVGVEMTRLHGKTMVRPLLEVRDEEGRGFLQRHRLGLLYALLGVAIVGYLAYTGWGYYQLAPAARRLSPLHRALKPAGPWGHGVGLVATAFMLSNFLYAARKRWGSLRGVGTLREWLHFHVFVGFMAPCVIAFHAAFQSRNLLATGTSVALAVVVLTGVVGRFIYGLVPSVEGRVEELDALAARFERIRERARPILESARNRGRLEATLALASRTVPRASLVGLAVRLPASALRLRFRIWRVRRFLPDAEARARFRDALVRLNRIRYQIGFYEALRALLRGWRVFHAALAVFLVLVMAAHIGITLYLGYGLD